MANNYRLVEDMLMLKLSFAVALLAGVTLSGAHAGTLANGTWAPSGCGADPGAAPTLDAKTVAAYNRTAKEVQAWQEKAKPFADCVVNEAKTDQNAIVESTNKIISAINDQSKALQAQSQAAIEKLKKQKS
jgi:hypothetical protein